MVENQPFIYSFQKLFMAVVEGVDIGMGVEGDSYLREIY